MLDRHLPLFVHALLGAAFGLVLSGCPEEVDAPVETAVAPDTVAGVNNGPPRRGGGGGGRGQRKGGVLRQEGVEVTAEYTDDGMALTYTSSDREQASSLQGFAAHKSGGSGRAGQNTDSGPWGWPDVEVRNTNLDDGVRIEFTSKDAEVVKQLQEYARHKTEDGDGARKPRTASAGNDAAMAVLTGSHVACSVTNLSDGVKLTYTARSKNKITELHDAAANQPFGPGADPAVEVPAHRGGFHHQAPFELPGVVIVTEQLDNGVSFSFTTRDDRVATRLQEYSRDHMAR